MDKKKKKKTKKESVVRVRQVLTRMGEMYARSNALSTYLPIDLGLPSPLHPSRSEEGRLPA